MNKNTINDGQIKPISKEELIKKTEELKKEEGKLELSETSYIRTNPDGSYLLYSESTLIKEFTFLPKTPKGLLKSLKEYLPKLKIEDSELIAVWQNLQEHILKIENKEELKPENSEFSEKELELANQSLKSPVLLNEIYKDITLTGKVGFQKEKMTVYLFLLTKKFKKPISFILISQSATGKNYLLKLVYTFEKLKVMTRKTQTALEHMELKSGTLDHYIFYIKELSGIEGQEDVKLMISEGELVLNYTIKDTATGDLVTKEKKIPGNFCFVSTTATKNIPEEMSTRVYKMSLGESSNQTEVIERFKSTYRQAKPIVENIMEINNRKLSAINSLIPEELEVLTPFSDFIKFPSDKVKFRREIDKIYTLIEAVTLLHFQQRKKIKIKNQEFLIATLQDYYYATEIAKDIIESSFQDITKADNLLFSECKNLAEEWCEQEEEKEMRRLARDNNSTSNLIQREVPLSDYQISIKKLVQKLKVSPNTVKMRLRNLYLAGFLDKVQEGGGRGKSTIYALSDNEITHYKLSTPEEIQENITLEVIENWKNLCGLDEKTEDLLKIISNFEKNDIFLEDDLSFWKDTILHKGEIKKKILNSEVVAKI